jgi:hypothetical protein
VSSAGTENSHPDTAQAPVTPGPAPCEYLGPKRPAAAAIHDEAVYDEQDDRPDDCRKPGRDVKELVHRVCIKQSSREEAPEQRAGDTYEGGHNPATGVVAGHESLCDRARE